MNNKSTLLKLLPQTEVAFQQHLKRAALATFTDKNTHRPVCKHLDINEYGWKYESLVPVTVPILHPTWPSTINDTLSYHCSKGGPRQCSCAKRSLPSHFASCGAICLDIDESCINDVTTFCTE